MRESDIEDYLIRCAEKLGGITRKLKYIGRKDAPDRLVLLPGFAAFVELKAPGKKPTPSQRRELELLRESGLNAVFINSFLGVEQLINQRR